MAKKKDTDSTPAKTTTAYNWHNSMVQHIKEKKARQADDAELDDAPDEADELPDEYQGEDDPRIWLRRNRSESESDMAAMETAAVDMVREARAATQVVTNAELDDVARTGQLVGVARHAQFMENTNRVLWLKAMQELKITGEYKHLPMQNSKGELVRPRNFAELCTAMGTSRSKVDEDLQNLAVFGGTLLEEQGRLGISYPELRALRAGIQGLPEDGQREVKDIVEAAAKSGDKMELLAALGEMGVYNTTLTQERDEARAQVEAQKKVQSKTAKRANELEIRLEQALNPSSEDERQKNLADARAALREQLDGECNALVGLAATLCNHVDNVRKADTERAPGVPALLDAPTWEHVNNRVSIMCQTLRDMLLGARLDVDFGTEFVESFTGMRGEPDDFMPEADESQQ